MKTKRQEWNLKRWSKLCTFLHFNNNKRLTYICENALFMPSPLGCLLVVLSTYPEKTSLHSRKRQKRKWQQNFSSAPGGPGDKACEIRSWETDNLCTLVTAVIIYVYKSVCSGQCWKSWYIHGKTSGIVRQKKKFPDIDKDTNHTKDNLWLWCLENKDT